MTAWIRIAQQQWQDAIFARHSINPDFRWLLWLLILTLTLTFLTASARDGIFKSV